jgi:hypothetical protein
MGTNLPAAEATPPRTKEVGESFVLVTEDVFGKRPKLYELAAPSSQMDRFSGFFDAEGSGLAEDSGWGCRRTMIESKRYIASLPVTRVCRAS